MRIGINARYTQSPHTGIETVLLNLLLNLKRIDRENEYFLFFGSAAGVPAFVPDSDFLYDISRMPTGNQVLKILWSHFYLPHAIGKNRVDVFHEPTFVAPIFKRCPTVVTIYDTAFLYMPEFYNRRSVLYLRALLSGSIRKADLIIAISENTKTDIVGNFDVSPGKIRVIPLGSGSDFRVLEDRERVEGVKRIYGIEGDYMLNVSLVSPRKNIAGLIKAFKTLKGSGRTDVKLVVAGGRGWLCEDVYREARSSGLESQIIFTGHVPKDHLVCLYNGARALVFPSFYEGFGLPVLEAMACGCPVVASNVSSLPEVCGDAALLADPRDTEGLADAMKRIDDEGSLRQGLIKKGLERIKMFSWEKMAERTLSVYKEAYASAKKGLGR